MVIPRASQTSSELSPCTSRRLTTTRCRSGSSASATASRSRISPAIAELSGNLRLAQLLSQILDQSERTLHLVFKSRDFMPLIIEQQKQLLQACEKSDVPAIVNTTGRGDVARAIAKEVGPPTTAPTGTAAVNWINCAQ